MTTRGWQTICDEITEEGMFVSYWFGIDLEFQRAEKDRNSSRIGEIIQIIATWEQMFRWNR